MERACGEPSFAKLSTGPGDQLAVAASHQGPPAPSDWMATSTAPMVVGPDAVPDTERFPFGLGTEVPWAGDPTVVVGSTALLSPPTAKSYMNPPAVAMRMFPFRIAGEAVMYPPVG